MGRKPPKQIASPPRWRALFSLRRELLSGVVFSALIHTAAIVALSLIALSTDAGNRLNPLFVSQSPSTSISLSELPVFEITAQSETPTIGNRDVSPNFDVHIPPPTAKLGAISDRVDKLPKPSDGVSSVVGELHGGAARSAADIQQRVGKAGGEQGEVQFALAWRNINDLDLHVITPAGQHISHMYRRSHCNGVLDVDMNVSGESREPVENVRWLEKAPSGRYSVLINLFRVHVADSGRTTRNNPFQLLVQLGKESTLRAGVIRPTQQVVVFRFHYFPSNLTPAERDQHEIELTELQKSDEVAAAPLLAEAKRAKEKSGSDQLLQGVVRRYPHTDAAIAAMRLLGGEIVK